MRGIPEETKKRILNAATDLFYANGIRAVGVNAIAVKANVTKRTLYKHFESKDELVIAYLQAQNEPVLAALIKSVSRSSGDVAEQIAGGQRGRAEVFAPRRWNGEHW